MKIVYRFRSADFTETGDPPKGWGVRVKRGQSVWQGLDHKYVCALAALHLSAVLAQVDLRQTRRLQDLGVNVKASVFLGSFHRLLS